jgi:hypothetical protein
MATESYMMNYGGLDVMMSGNFWRYTSYIPYFWRMFCSSETWTFTPAGNSNFPNPTGSNYIHIAPQAGKKKSLDEPFTVAQRAVNLAGLSTPNPAAATCFNTKTIITKLVFDGSPVLTEIPT